MEGAKQSGSSFTSDLFGSKDSSASSSSRIFDSIFAPPAQVSEQAYLHPQESGKNCAPGNTVGSGKTGVSGSNTRSGEGQSLRIPNKDPSLCQEDKAQPFHYSSSIYYGGQDVYRPQSTQSTATTTFGKDGEEDDSGSASRGNWWQGSLYY